MTRNIRLIVEYEGTGYAGWQSQAGLPTIQGELAGAIKKLTRPTPFGVGAPEPKLIGASRTDAGVHALGQTANFHTDCRIPLAGMLMGLNSLLPSDIVIKAVEEAGTEFDSRRDARGKTYIYKILNRGFPSALLRRWTWFVHKPLDISLMREGARRIVGKKDFSSFMAAHSDSLHSVREVTSIDVRDAGDGVIEIEVSGTAFLRHMVRIMAGTLVAAGTGRIRPAQIETIIEARDRTKAPMTAPPHGLFLMKVEY
ncbi:MAG: tRNA pseudouridine(38-40) synthase TruA [Deltaproteobacteria bacterium]|nr:tRNA pseudouridine(38-40) synthase TruA [Deltaproteobacteria bacterium]